MSHNIDSANAFLLKAKAATEKRDFELAKAYTELAQVVMLGHAASKLDLIASKLDRLASVANSGRSWH
jgi:hypothetical protein